MNMNAEREAILDGIKKFAAAAAFPDVKAEATLRRAALQIFLSENSDALGGGWIDEVVDDLARLERSTTDRRMIYLSRLLRGQYLQARGRLDEAAIAYQAATDLIPEAASARLGLASVSYLRGMAAGSDAVFTSLASRAGYDADPWASYRYGDYRLWGERLQALRAHVRREASR